MCPLGGATSAQHLFKTKKIHKIIHSARRCYLESTQQIENHPSHFGKQHILTPDHTQNPPSISRPRSLITIYGIACPGALKTGARYSVACAFAVRILRLSQLTSIIRRSTSTLHNIRMMAIRFAEALERSLRRGGRGDLIFLEVRFHNSQCSYEFASTSRLPTCRFRHLRPSRETKNIIRSRIHPESNQNLSRIHPESTQHLQTQDITQEITQDTTQDTTQHATLGTNQDTTQDTDRVLYHIVFAADAGGMLAWICRPLRGW